MVTAASAADLGDKAAKVNVKEWVKGDKVDVTQSGDHVYVVEFWATWCGPCIDSIPHMSELQKKLKGKVTFIGVSTDSAKTVDKVKPFVKKMGDKMNYTVAIDNDRKTADGYMKAFKIIGIPHAFVVQNGKIVWHQNPHPQSPDGDLGEVLDLVLAGKFDTAAAKKRLKENEERMAEMTANATRMGEYYQEYLRLVRSTGNKKEAAELGAKLIDIGKDNDGMLNALAWAILTDKGIVDRDLKLALRAAKLANKATDGESAAILDTYALALFENGKKKEALRTQEKAVKLAREAGDEDMLKDLEQRLERFRKETP